MKEIIKTLKPYLFNLPIIVLAMALCIFAAQKYLSYSTPLYESTVKLKLADLDNGVPSGNLFKDLDVFVSENKIAVEIEVIKSAVLLNKVLDQLDFDNEIYRVGKIRTSKLYKNSPICVQGTFSDNKAYDTRIPLTVISNEEFIITPPGSKVDVRGKFGYPVIFPYGQLLLNVDKDCFEHKPDLKLIDKYELEFPSRQQQLANIASRLDVVAVDKDVSIIRISYKSAVPEQSALLINKLAEVYIQDYIETKYRAAETTVKFLETQITEVAGKLTSAENNIENYRNDKHITNLRQETETDLRKISQLKIQQTNLGMNLKAADELNNYIVAGKDKFLELAPNFEAFTDLLSTEIVKKIKQLQSEKKDLLLVYTPKDERVQVIDRKLEDLTSYLVESIANTKRNLKTKYDQLGQDIVEAEKVFIGVPEKEKVLTILNRDFEIYQQSYNFLTEKKIEAEIAKAAKIAFHRIITPAVPSQEPSSPNRKIIVIVSAILGLFMAVLLIYLMQIFNAKINDTEVIEQSSTIPIAFSVPMFYKKEAIGKQFVQSAILLELKNLLHDHCKIVVSSKTGKEGTSFIVQNLAEAIAQQGRKVLVLDMATQLISEKEAEETGLVSSSKGFDIKAFSVKERLLLNSKQNLNRLIEAYENQYEVILINNVATKDDGSALLYMSSADVNLYVMDARSSSPSQLLEVDVLQKEYKLPNLYFVLNRIGHSPGLIQQVFYLITKKFFKPKQAQSSLV